MYPVDEPLGNSTHQLRYNDAVAHALLSKWCAALSQIPDTVEQVHRRYSSHALMLLRSYNDTAAQLSSRCYGYATTLET
jgi:hypothetical protein